MKKHQTIKHDDLKILHKTQSSSQFYRVKQFKGLKNNNTNNNNNKLPNKVNIGILQVQHILLYSTLYFAIHYK